MKDKHTEDSARCFALIDFESNALNSIAPLFTISSQEEELQALRNSFILFPTSLQIDGKF